MSGGGGGEDEPRRAGQNVFGEASTPDVDLNLTALMDILSNLLFFLLASFGATVIMAINVTVPTQSSDKSDVAETVQAVTLAVKISKTAIDVGATSNGIPESELGPLARRIPNQGETPDIAAFAAHLYDIKQKYPKSDTMILTPESGTRYDVLVKVMDAARERPVDVAGQDRNLKLFPTVVVSTVVK